MEYDYKIGVVILNFNSYYKLGQCLKSIEINCQNNYIHIYIVDNNSSENVDLLHQMEDSYIKNCKYEISFIFLSENNGYSNGNLVGINRAIKDDCNYILISNPDVIFMNDSIDKMYRVLKKYDDVTIVGPDIRDLYNNSIRFGSDELDFCYHFINRSARRICPIEVRELGKVECYKGTLLGCCFMFRAQWIKDFIIFDENIFMYREEQLIAKYIIDNNKFAAITLEAKIQHNHTKSLKRNGFYFYYSSLSGFYILRKYYNLNYYLSVIQVLKNIISYLIGCYVFRISFKNLPFRHYVTLNLCILQQQYYLLK